MINPKGGAFLPLIRDNHPEDFLAHSDHLVLTLMLMLTLVPVALEDLVDMDPFSEDPEVTEDPPDTVGALSVVKIVDLEPMVQIFTVDMLEVLPEPMLALTPMPMPALEPVVLEEVRSNKIQ